MANYIENFPLDIEFMIPETLTLLRFDEFIEQYPEDGGHYELHHGAIVEMRPTGNHEKVAALISTHFPHVKMYYY